MEYRRVSASERLLTLEEFERLPEEDGFDLELVRGRLVREPAPAPRHGQLSIELGAGLHVFARAHELGAVLANVGFVLAEEPPTVRAPDLAFVARERIPPEGFDAGFWHVAPDLAVEILSPSNRYSEIQEKVTEYLEAGSRLVWVVDPRKRSVTVYRSRHDVRVLTGREELDGDPVLEGFRLPLGDLFGE